MILLLALSLLRPLLLSHGALRGAPQEAALGALGAPGAERSSSVKQLFDEGRWNNVVQAVTESPDEPADLELFRGLALAKLGRWEDARRAFAAGLAGHPRDARFLDELAGVAYQQKRFAESKRYLRKALDLNPRDEYANDFLGSIYFLEDNLEAALKYWNRAGKPKIANLRYNPQPRVNPLILDRAAPFSPGEELLQEEFLASQERLESLEIFPRVRLDLEPEADGSFDEVIRAPERDGWGGTKLAGAVSLLRGLPYESVYPEFYDLGHAGINELSFFRWDDQKRRASSELSGPLWENPNTRFRIYFDGRNENWNLSGTILPGSTAPAFANMRRAAAGAEMRFLEGARWQWSAGAEYSYRDFRALAGIPAQASAFFTDGSALEARGGARRWLVRAPERRFTLEGRADGAFGTFFHGALGRYARAEGAISAKWFPQASGEDYETQANVRAGGTRGNAPMDELFELGFDRDNELWMRGHPGLRDGQKGGAPMGRDCVLANIEMDKIAYRNPIFTLKAGPFLDTGDVYDPSGFWGSPKWLWDTGAQAKIRVLGSMELVVGYGKDLRSGRNSFFATVER